MTTSKLMCLITVFLTFNSIAACWASEKNSTVPDWEDPQVISRNKEPGHAYMRPYAEEKNLLNKKASGRIQSLNGQWKFIGYSKIVSFPAFLQPGLNKIIDDRQLGTDNAYLTQVIALI